MSITLKLYAEWPGEPAAGLRGGSEEVTITFAYSDALLEEEIDLYKSALAQQFDRARVMTESELLAQEAEFDRMWKEADAEEDRLNREGIL